MTEQQRRGNGRVCVELDLSRNRLGAHAARELLALLEDARCRVRSLRLAGADVDDGEGAAVAGALAKVCVLMAAMARCWRVSSRTAGSSLRGMARVSCQKGFSSHVTT